MNINVREFLSYSYNHGDYITILKNQPIKEVLWEGKFETMKNEIPTDVAKSNVAKWGIENNSIVIYVNYNKKD